MVSQKKSLVIYILAQCDTCRKALQFLDHHGVMYEKKDIRLSPPSPEEIKQMATLLGDVRLVMNTRGNAFRDDGIEEIMEQLSEKQLYELLSQKGDYVKRPFAYETDGVVLKKGIVGFNEEEWKALWHTK